MKESEDINPNISNSNKEQIKINNEGKFDNFYILDGSKSYKHQKIPILRIKKLIKKLTKVKLLSNEVPFLMGKALEMFILDFSYRSWIFSVIEKRKTIKVILFSFQKRDIINCISNTLHFDFLMDLFPESIEERNILIDKNSYISSNTHDNLFIQ